MIRLPLPLSHSHSQSHRSAPLCFTCVRIIRKLRERKRRRTCPSASALDPFPPSPVIHASSQSRDLVADGFRFVMTQSKRRHQRRRTDGRTYSEARNLTLTQNHDRTFVFEVLVLGTAWRLLSSEPRDRVPTACQVRCYLYCKSDTHASATFAGRTLRV